MSSFHTNYRVLCSTSFVISLKFYDYVFPRKNAAVKFVNQSNEEGKIKMENV